MQKKCRMVTIEYNTMKENYQQKVTDYKKLQKGKNYRNWTKSHKTWFFDFSVWNCVQGVWEIGWAVQNRDWSDAPSDRKSLGRNNDFKKKY